MTAPTPAWPLARRTERMNPSVIREILKVTERPGIISFAGGLPAAETFAVDAFRAAADAVLCHDGPAALQYAASEGYAPLREAVAAQLPWQPSPDQVLITSGSQQGLDLVGKLLLDAQSPVLVEQPTYLGALMAFAPMEPAVHALACDADGVLPESLVQEARALAQQGTPARFAYLLPNFQNPTGRTLGEARRTALLQAAQSHGVPLVEDNPYGDLWFDQPPPPPLAARMPDSVIYLGSFSKTLAPGLRLGFVVAPKAVFPKLLQAKQAADLHTSGFNQRLVHHVLASGAQAAQVPRIRELYRQRRNAMDQALQRHGAPLGMQWQVPNGGMFLWCRLPAPLSALTLLPQAVEAGVAYVPGAPFYVGQPDPANLRLNFTNATPAQIDHGVQLLCGVVAQALAQARTSSQPHLAVAGA
jgi:2-aminoadipate transaminase